MTNKLLIIVSILLVFLGCSEKQYQHMYDNKTNIFDSHMQTQGENEQNSIQNGQNPMKRPSYDEYRQR